MRKEARAKAAPQQGTRYLERRNIVLLPRSIVPISRVNPPLGSCPFLGSVHVLGSTSWGLGSTASRGPAAGRRAGQR
jgi:hypothetical protein